MSTVVSYRAALVREIEQAMLRLNNYEIDSDYDQGHFLGQCDAYALVLLLLKDEDL